jgi:hypothetical protein
VGAPTVTGTAHQFILAYCTDLVKIAKKTAKEDYYGFIQ